MRRRICWSLKPIIYAANMDEAGFADHTHNAYFLQGVRELAEQEGAQVLPICAKLEQDIAELDADPEERAMFLTDLGIEKSGLDRLIQCSWLSFAGTDLLPDLRQR